MIKRSSGVVYKLSEQQNFWLNNKCCPICGLIKKDWKRRTDWRCCSTNCTEKFSEITLIWQDIRLKVFKRDNYTCVKCGEKPTTKDYYDSKKIVPNDAMLIGDHIKPIALGGDEWDLDNIQTLCKKCDKKKTKQDHKDLSKQRMIEKKQLVNQKLMDENKK